MFCLSSRAFHSADCLCFQVRIYYPEIIKSREKNDVRRIKQDNLQHNVNLKSQYCHDIIAEFND